MVYLGDRTTLRVVGRGVWLSQALQLLRIGLCGAVKYLKVSSCSCEYITISSCKTVKYRKIHLCCTVHVKL